MNMKISIVLLIGLPVVDAMAAYIDPGEIGPPNSTTIVSAESGDEIGVWDACSRNDNCITSYSGSFGTGVASTHYYLKVNDVKYKMNPYVDAYSYSSVGSFTSAMAEMKYYFEITTPVKENTSYFPELIDVNIYAQGKISGYAMAELSIYQEGSNSYVLHEQLNSQNSSDSYFSGPFKRTVFSNTLYVVDMFAYAWSRDGVKSNAEIDPLVKIDPSALVLIPDAQLYLSPGIDQVEDATPVPVPNTFSLFGIGLAALCFLKKRN